MFKLAVVQVSWRLFFILFFFSSASIAQTRFELASANAAKLCASMKGKSSSVVVPFRPGGGFDVDARAFKPFLQRHSGMQVSVLNMPGASGVLAANAVAESRSDHLMILLSDPRFILMSSLQGVAGSDISAFMPLGSLGRESAVWATQRRIDWHASRASRLTASSAGEMVSRIALPAAAMGLTISTISGYQSSNETWLASLRGELDIVPLSQDSAQRMLKTEPSATVSLVLTSAPDPDFPGVPYLAGPGGIVDQLSRSLDISTRQKRMAMGSLAVQLANSNRFFFASLRLPLASKSCIVAAIDAALIDPERLATNSVRESDKVPQKLAEIEVQLAQIQREVSIHRTDLTELIRNSAVQR